MEQSEQNRVVQAILDIGQILLDVLAILLALNQADPLRIMMALLASQSITILENDRPRMRHAEGAAKFIAGLGILFLEMPALFFAGVVVDIFLNGGQISLGLFKVGAITASVIGHGFQRLGSAPVYVEQLYQWLDTPAAVVAEQPPVLTAENLKKVSNVALTSLNRGATSAVQGITRKRQSPDITILPKQDDTALENVRQVSNR